MERDAARPPVWTTARTLAVLAVAALLSLVLRAARALAAPAPGGDDCTPAPPHGSCWSDWADAPVEGWELGRESNVYAAYALDALRPECAAVAARRLEDRLRATLDLYGWSPGGPEARIADPRSGADVHPFASWLSGAVVTHVFNAAFELRRAGIGVDPGLLASVEVVFASIPVPQDPGCGLRSLPSVNSCMDDFALTASASAWIAAWECGEGRDADPWAVAARAFVAEALAPMSEHGGGPCFFAVETLADGARRARCDAPGGVAKVMGADHGRENPSYGLGLMTSVASACAALYFTGRPCAFTDGEADVARGLFRHGQEKASSDGAAFNGPGPAGCVDFADPDGATKDCSDADTLVYSGGGYRPSDFPVRLFYDKRGVGGLDPEPAYQFDAFCDARVTWRPDGFFGANRRAFYQRLAWDIFR